MTSDVVYKLLEKEIILGHLKPRERLPESALCRRLKASRTLLREVFRRLEGAGLVAFQPNRGVAVRDFSPSEVEDVYYLRTALERPRVPSSYSGSGPRTFVISESLRASSRRPVAAAPWLR